MTTRALERGRRSRRRGAGRGGGARRASNLDHHQTPDIRALEVALLPDRDVENAQPIVLGRGSSSLPRRLLLIPHRHTPTLSHTPIPPPPPKPPLHPYPTHPPTGATSRDALARGRARPPPPSSVADRLRSRRLQVGQKSGPLSGDGSRRCRADLSPRTHLRSRTLPPDQDDLHSPPPFPESPPPPPTPPPPPPPPPTPPSPRPRSPPGPRPSRRASARNGSQSVRSTAAGRAAGRARTRGRRGSDSRAAGSRSRTRRPFSSRTSAARIAGAARGNGNRRERRGLAHRRDLHGRRSSGSRAPRREALQPRSAGASPSQTFFVTRTGRAWSCPVARVPALQLGRRRAARAWRVGLDRVAAELVGEDVRASAGVHLGLRERGEVGAAPPRKWSRTTSCSAAASAAGSARGRAGEHRVLERRP